MMYADLCDAKAICRIDHDDDDLLIIGYLESASSMVKNYLKSVSPYEPSRDADDTPDYDSNGYSIKDITLNAVRYEVRLAVLLLVRMLFDGEFTAQPGYLPAEVTALLYPIRDPALA